MERKTPKEEPPIPINRLQMNCNWSLKRRRRRRRKSIRELRGETAHSEFGLRTPHCACGVVTVRGNFYMADKPCSIFISSLHTLSFSLNYRRIFGTCSCGWLAALAACVHVSKWQTLTRHTAKPSNIFTYENSLFERFYSFFFFFFSFLSILSA